MAGNVSQMGLGADPYPEVYLPIAQSSDRAMVVMTRTGGEASSLSAEAGAAGAGTSAAAPGSAAKPGDDLNALIAGLSFDWDVKKD